MKQNYFISVVLLVIHLTICDKFQKNTDGTTIH